MKSTTKKEKLVQRSEANQNISEFNLTEVGKEKVKLNELLKTIKKNSTHKNIKNQLNNAQKEKTLDVPLSKPQAERIKRSLAYGKVSGEVKKWDSIVRANRSAEQIVYPLKQPELRLEAAEEYVKRFQTKNTLEQEVSKLLNSSENVLEQNKALTVAEEKALKAMSLAEAKARHGELRKMRALLSFKEAKAKRQKKIKSKKYHRILRKEKMRQMMKEFEQLQKSDPELAKEKLKEVDKLRILERMTLKHKSTGKWAKQQKLRAKYNPESRVALKEQLNLAKQLTDKSLVNNEDLEDDIDISQLDNIEADDEDEEKGEDGDLLDLYKLSEDVPFKKPKLQRKLKSTRNKMQKTLKVPISKPNEEEDREDDESAPAPLVDETCERLQTMDDYNNIDEISKSSNAPSEPSETPVLKSVPKPHICAEKRQISKQKGTYVSELDFASETKVLESLVPDEVTLGEEGLDDEEKTDLMNIRQAFADEDFIAEFNEDKKAAVKRDQPQGIDLYLPGWGMWGGTGINPSKRKRKRFYIKPVNILTRKDETLGNVIINEDKDKKAAQHQVSDLPFQFKTVHQFESTIRQPVGNTWNTETSFQKMIAPKVVTKLGKIIEPIDTDDLALQKKPAAHKKFPKKQQKVHKGKSKRKARLK